MRKRYWLLLLVLAWLARRGLLSSGTVAHISHTDQDDSSYGLIFLTEDTNLEPVRSRQQLRELLSPAEYRQALDTTQYFDKDYHDLQGRHWWTWRARDYKVFDDSLLVTDRYTAKLLLVLDNTLGSGRQYFFQVRTYTKDHRLLDQAEFASWSDTKKEFCSGWLTDDHFLIRSCDDGEEIRRVNQSGHFIRPSRATVAWLKLRGY
jgi:hypothetical protein